MAVETRVTISARGMVRRGVGGLVGGHDRILEADEGVEDDQGRRLHRRERRRRARGPARRRRPMARPQSASTISGSAFSRVSRSSARTARRTPTMLMQGDRADQQRDRRRPPDHAAERRPERGGVGGEDVGVGGERGDPRDIIEPAGLEGDERAERRRYRRPARPRPDAAAASRANGSAISRNSRPKIGNSQGLNAPNWLHAASPEARRCRRRPCR